MKLFLLGLTLLTSMPSFAVTAQDLDQLRVQVLDAKESGDSELFQELRIQYQATTLKFIDENSEEPKIQSLSQDAIDKLISAANRRDDELRRQIEILENSTYSAM